MRRDVTRPNYVNPWTTSQEFRKLILKLRWIGSEDEVDRLEAYLARTAPPNFSYRVAGDTD
jgi:hypothetical protein